MAYFNFNDMFGFLFRKPTMQLAKKNGKDEDTPQKVNYLVEQIRYFLSSPQRSAMLDGYRYWLGDHDINGRRRTVCVGQGRWEEDKNLPNNKIVDNQYGRMVTIKTNYIAGQPITFSSENDDFASALNEVFDEGFHETFSQVIQDCYNCGISWLMPNYNEEGKLIFTRLAPWEICAMWQDTAHTRLDTAIRVYSQTTFNGKSEVSREKCDIFTKEGIKHFELNGREIYADKDKSDDVYFTCEYGGQVYVGAYPEVPLIYFKRNQAEQPLIVGVKALQDSLNIMESDFMNSMQENCGGNAVLVITNFDGANISELKTAIYNHRVIKLRSTASGGQADVKALEIPLNKDNFETAKACLKRAIVEGCFCYDVETLKGMSSPNTTSIKLVFQDLDIDANKMEVQIQSSLKKLINSFVIPYLANIGRGNFEGQDYEIILNRDQVINEQETLTTLIQAGLHLPNKWLVGQVPNVNDPQAVLDMLDKEQEDQVAMLDPYTDLKTPANEGVSDDTTE